MPRKKYRQQRDDSILDASPPHADADAGAEASHAKSPVSHSDDEGNVVIELDPESVATAVFVPIPELAEVPSLTANAVSEAASPVPEEAAAAAAASPVPEEAAAAAASLASEEAAASAASLAPEEAAAAAASLAPEEAAASHIHPVQKIKSESETTATATSTATSTATPTASTPSRWGRFKAWFSSFSACACACPCTRHRKRRTSIQLKDEPTQQQDAPATAPITTT
jgi:hypothetical protein